MINSIDIPFWNLFRFIFKATLASLLVSVLFGIMSIPILIALAAFGVAFGGG